MAVEPLQEEVDDIKHILARNLIGLWHQDKELFRLAATSLGCQVQQDNLAPWLDDLTAFLERWQGQDDASRAE